MTKEPLTSLALPLALALALSPALALALPPTQHTKAYNNVLITLHLISVLGNKTLVPCPE